MKRLMRLILSISVIVTMSTPLSVKAADSTVKEYTPITKTYDHVLFEAKEITDTSILQKRAEQGIDELQSRRGNKIQIESKKIGNIEVENTKTSQLLGTVLVGDKIVEEYAITVVSKVNGYDTASNNVSGNGCTLLTRVYCLWGMSSKDELSFQFSKATVTGTGSPISLIMQHSIYSGYTENLSYYNSKPFANPSGTYTLNSNHTDYISDYGSYISAGDILNFSDGTSLETMITVTPYGYWPLDK